MHEVLNIKYMCEQKNRFLFGKSRSLRKEELHRSSSGQKALPLKKIRTLLEQKDLLQESTSLQKKDLRRSTISPLESSREQSLRSKFLCGKYFSREKHRAKGDSDGSHF
jgi:hypothetical protein